MGLTVLVMVEGERNLALLTGEMTERKQDTAACMHLIQVTGGCQIPAQARPQPSDTAAKRARCETIIYLYNKDTLEIGGSD